MSNNYTGEIIIPVESSRDYILEVMPVNVDFFSFGFIKQFLSHTLGRILTVSFLLAFMYLFIRMILLGKGGFRS